MAHSEGTWSILNNHIVCNIDDKVGVTTICKINQNISGWEDNLRLINQSTKMLEFVKKVKCRKTKKDDDEIIKMADEILNSLNKKGWK